MKASCSFCEQKGPKKLSTHSLPLACPLHAGPREPRLKLPPRQRVAGKAVTARRSRGSPAPKSVVHPAPNTHRLGENTTVKTFKTFKRRFRTTPHSISNTPALHFCFWLGTVPQRRKSVFQKILGWVVGIFVVLYILGTMAPPSQVTGLRIPSSNTAWVRTPKEPDVTLASVLNAPHSAGPVTLPQPTDYRVFCTEQWTKRGVVDNSMVEYCIRIEREGYDTIGRTAARYAGLFWLQNVPDRAAQQWTKRGVRQDSMVSFELKNQIDGFLDLQYEMSQGRLDDTAGTACLDEWTQNVTPNWPMIKFCYKRRTGRD